MKNKRNILCSRKLFRELSRDELKELEVGCVISNNDFVSCSSDFHVTEMFIDISLKGNTSSNHSQDA